MLYLRHRVEKGERVMDKSKNTPDIPEAGFFSLLIVYAAAATAAVVFLLFILPDFWLLWAVPVLFLPAVINKVLKRELEPDPAANLKVGIALLVSLFLSAALTILYFSNNESTDVTVRLALWCFNTILCGVVRRNYKLPIHWKIPKTVMYLSQLAIGVYWIIYDMIWYLL